MSDIDLWKKTVYLFVHFFLTFRIMVLQAGTAFLVGSSGRTEDTEPTQAMEVMRYRAAFAVTGHDNRYIGIPQVQDLRMLEGITMALIGVWEKLTISNHNC